MSVTYTPPTGPGTVEVSWKLTEDEFLLLRGLLGKIRYCLLDEQYYEATDIKTAIDPNGLRTRALIEKCVPELASR